MSLRRILADFQFLRRLLFPLLSRMNVEVRWRHDVTRRGFSLMTWLHKGYWYYGDARELNELNRFEEFIESGDCVLEVGGHIGYITQIFEKLVGEGGRVFVAEPTPFNRNILQKNVLPKTTVLPLALSDTIGEVDFYLEEFGGYTNSIEAEVTKNSHRELTKNQHKTASQVTKISVPVSTVDDVCKRYGITPKFLKIDAEGHEIKVLKGSINTLPEIRALMVEVSQHHAEVYNLMHGFGFRAKDAKGKNIVGAFQGGNIFFYRETST